MTKVANHWRPFPEFTDSRNIPAFTKPRSASHEKRASILLSIAVLLVMNTAAQQNSDDRFFVVASKNTLGWGALGTPSVNDSGDIVIRCEISGQYQHRVFLDSDQLNKTTQGNIQSYMVRQSTLTLCSFPQISNNKSVASYVIGQGYQYIDRYDLLLGPTVLWAATNIASADATQSRWPFSFLSPIVGIDSASPPNTYIYAERQPLIGPYNKRIYASSTYIQYPALATPLASCPDAFSALETYVACSANGNVVYRGTDATFGKGIYRGIQNLPVATDQNHFPVTGIRPGINSSNTVAFYSSYDNTIPGVYVRLANEAFDRGAGNLASAPTGLSALRIPGDLPTAYDLANRIMLNDYNQVAFFGTENNNQQAIYSTCLGSMRRIISAGDTISYAGTSARVTGLGVFNGLGVNGEIVFQAFMSNGDELVVRANRAFNQQVTEYSPIIPSYHNTFYLLYSVPNSGFPNATHPAQSIGKVGCNLTSTANILNYYGATVSPIEFQNWLISRYQGDPDHSLNYINSNNDFEESALEEFSEFLISEGKASRTVRSRGTHNTARGPNLNAIITELRAGRPVKIRVPSGGGTAYKQFGHYIIAYGLIDPSKVDNSIGPADILIADPGKHADFTLAEYGKLGTPNTYDVQFANWIEDQVGFRRRVYLYNVTPQPIIIVSVHSPVDIMLTDAQGRRAGYSSATGVLTEIPDSDYYEETSYYTLEDDGSAGAPAWGADELVKHIIVSGVSSGSFTLDGYGTGSGSYDMTVVGNGGCVSDMAPVSGIINSGDHITFSFNVMRRKPEIMSAQVLAAGIVQWTAVGDPSSPLFVQISTNLVDWASIPGAQFTNGIGVISVNVANSPALFLRAYQ